MKREVYYVVEVMTNDGWIHQGLCKRKTFQFAERDIADWKREDPEVKLRIVRVTTTEEREVVG